MGDVKEVLRKRTIESVFKLHICEPLNEAARSMLLSLWNFRDSLEATIESIQQPQNLSVLCGVLELLSIFFEKHKETGNSETILSALFACLSANLNPSYPKIDSNNVLLIKYAAKVASLFPDSLPDHVQACATNPHLAALALCCVAWSGPDEERLKSVIPLIPSKLATTTLCYGVLALMSTHKEFENCPSVKNVVALYRSISDRGTIFFLSPVIMRICLIRMGPSMLKDLPPCIGFLSKKLREHLEDVPLFCYLLEHYLEIPDAVATIKQYSGRLMKLFLMSISKQTPTDSLGDPSNYIRTKSGEAFVSLLNLMSIKPFETFFPHHIETKAWEVLLLVYFMIQKMPQTYFAADSIDPLLRQFLPGFKGITPASELMVLVCDFFVRNFQTRSALNFLVEALEKGSHGAADVILNAPLPFAFVFPRLSRALTPGKSLPIVVETLKSYLQVHVPETGNSVCVSDMDAQSSSDSNFDIPEIRSMSSLPDWTETEEMPPTDETILFCNLVVSVEQYPDLFPLLPLAAGALSPQFSQALMKRFPSPGQHRYQLNSLSSFGTALQFLDVKVISALAHTFLMILPGPAMLFLAMTIQRLPRKIMLKSLTKTMPFVLADPDKASRMIALIAYAHPDASITFIDTLLANSPIKRRVFFVMKFSDTGEQVLSVVFRTIGYCSIFLDIVYFNDTFLPFATKFLNKYLTHESKSPELYKSALFAIKKLSYRVKCCQEEHVDQLFPFKDFLVQYVCAFYVDVGDVVASGMPDWRLQVETVPTILSALSALLPLRPMRISDKHERAAELTAFFLQCVDNDDDFQSILKAAKVFFATLLQCNPSLTVFMGVSLPMFPALILHPHWKELCHLMLFVTSHWDKLNLQLSSDVLSRVIADIGILIGYVLPLTEQPDVGRVAGEIIYALTSLQCLIRNQILSLPKSIRPTLTPIDEATGESLTQSICAFLGKYFMASQVFDVILSLVDLLVDNKLSPIHYRGTAISIKHLLKEKGSEEFRYDARIVSSLIRSMDRKSDEVIDQYLEIFEILMSMRMFSVLSVFTAFNSSLSDHLFEGIINHIVKVEGGASQLLSMIAAALIDDEGESDTDFYLRALPMVRDNISELDNETWSKLLVGIAKRVDSEENPLFKVLSGSESFESILEFGMLTAENRLLSLPIILAELPERPIRLFIRLALAFAAASEESCSPFLEYACSALASRFEPSCFEIMKRVFENIEFKHWGTVSEDLTVLLIQHMRVEDDVMNCCISFVNKLESEALEFFWTTLSDISSASIDRWTDSLQILVEKCSICYSAIAQLIPSLVVREDCIGIVKSLAKRLSIDDSLPEMELCEAILRSEEFKSHITNFLSSFVSMLDDDCYATQCSRIIGNLCEVTNDDTKIAIKAIINKMATGKLQDKSFTAEMLLRLLK